MADPVRPHLAFLGTGLMGRPMAARLQQAGYPVAVWNRTIDKARSLANLGATVAASPAEAIRSAEAVLLMLADSGAIRATILADNSRALLRGRTVLQMGTIAPAESTELARDVELLGGSYLEAPVLGSIPEAEAGRLVIMVGADPDQLERWRPVLEVLGTEPRLAGPVGHAAALKLAHNQLIATLTTGYAVGLGMVRRAGVDVELWANVVRSSALYAPAFDKKLPSMVERSYYPANFPARHLLKDVRLAADAATTSGVFAPHLAGIDEILVRTLAAGLGDADYSALAAAIDPARDPSSDGTR
jgi:3-hydroxyisobutyrate dehydrogenase-like beta-hydroxyacid dehydrogenase